MRYATLMFALILSQSVFAFPIFRGPGPQRFEGTGKWKSQCGQSGDYTAQLSFQDNELNARIDYNVSVPVPRGSLGSALLTYRVAAVAENNGMFQVTGGRELSAVIGDGYCFQNVCHYRAGFKDASVEEMFYLDGNDLYVVGSKEAPAASGQQEQCNRIAWSAKLAKVK